MAIVRIAYLSGSYIPSREANSVHVMKMCSAFSGLGYEVLLIARGEERDIELDFADYGVQTRFSLRKVRDQRRTLANRLFYPFLAAKTVQGIWQESDLLYARHLPSLLVAFFATRSNFILELHSPPGIVNLMVIKTLITTRRFRRLVVISASLKKRMLSLLGPEWDDSITVAHDGADSPPNELAEGAVQPVRAGTAPGLRVGYVGHLYPGRGIEVVGELARRMPEVEFNLVGGRESDIVYWKNEFMGLSNVIFHGHVRPAEVYKFQRRMDVLLAPYAEVLHHAGGAHNTAPWMSPLKIFEYMASGRAIIASDLPVLREVLCDGLNALLAPPDDIEAWVQALRRLQDDSLRQKLGTEAATILVKNYTWTERARRVLRETSLQ